MNPTPPKPLYVAMVPYRTPAGRKTWVRISTAGYTKEDLREQIGDRLRNAELYGRRRVRNVLWDEVTLANLGFQISKVKPPIPTSRYPFLTDVRLEE
jgi:hypothetical protein